LAPVTATTPLERFRPENGLLELVAGMVRGPRRDGLFAVWLLVRVVRDFQLDPPFPDRLQRRRVAALEARLTSLTVPAPLRRASASALGQLREPATANPAMVLAQLVAPVRESASAEAADLLADLAHTTREAGTGAVSRK
jgi:hypothetical protein